MSIVKDPSTAPICVGSLMSGASMSCKQSYNIRIDESPSEAKEKKLPKKGMGASWR